MSDTAFPVALAPTVAQLRAIIGSDAPLPESRTPSAGAAMFAASDQHVHPRLSSTTPCVIAANGEAVCPFTRTFDTLPGIPQPAYDDPAKGQPVIFSIKSWLAPDGVAAWSGSGPVGGVVMQAQRAAPIPQNLATLLLGGVLSLFSGSAVGVTFRLVAIQQS